MASCWCEARTCSPATGAGPRRRRRRSSDGWFRTGDLAERADDGYYTLRGRRTDLIISGGFNIYPREIEELLAERRAFAKPSSSACPTPRRGELPVAYIVADATVDTPALEQLCRRSLASFKVPRAFIRVDALPRTALGKVQKHLLPPWRGFRETVASVIRGRGRQGLGAWRNALV